MLCLEHLLQPGVSVVNDIPLRPVPDPDYVDVQVARHGVLRVYRKQRYISNRGNLKSDVLLRRYKELVESRLRRRKRRSQEKIAEDVQVKLRKIPARRIAQDIISWRPRLESWVNIGLTGVCRFQLLNGFSIYFFIA